ncbi:MAG: SUMF1/EgtB/PvdO family nonheme iron enzyme [Bacteroidales bacterium]|jgi:formylglycine-generating enzyme required for sulfatase activity|nr:SUMF1/EgtB/PvdO family nonheme iron enzyme [Bacteroidales bacterium]
MKKSFFLTLIAIVLIINACNNSGNGQLVGVKDRPTFVDEIPYGMKYIGNGHFLMGAGTQDAAYSLTSSPKNITLKAFYMDETEITNNEYRQFVNWVRDSIAHILLGNAGLEDEDEYAHFVTYGKGHEEEGEPVEPRLINWKTKIDWNSTNAEYRAALEPIYSSPLSGNERYYHYAPIELNAKILNFEYWWVDKRNYRDPEDPDVMGAAFKDFDNIDPQTDDQGMYQNRPVAYSQGKGPFIKRESINIYPDTLCWIFDFTYSFNEPLANSYFWHPQYDNYPVVGVNWKQAKAFCAWRTHIRNVYLGSVKGWAYENEFRLPNESEWEYAARGGLHASDYPWGGPYPLNDNGCFLANFKPRRGDYFADGGTETIIVAHYHPNDFGLYDMAGNVAEWCEDAFNESAYNFAHDLNMQYTYNAKKSDSEVMKRKVIRGGSWKDISYFLHNAARSYEYQDTGKSYIGFRCVQSYLGRDRGDNLKTASNVY